MDRLKIIKFIYVFIGIISFIIGFIGIFLPLLPTTPFMLLSAFMFMRGSEKLHQLLLNSQFGPAIKLWQKERKIAYKTKILALISLVCVMSVSILLIVPLLIIKILLGIIGICVFGYILKIPTK